MRVLMFAVAMAVAPACLLEEPNTRSTPQELATKNKLAANKLAANKLAANKLAANKLAANSLTSTKLVALNETAEILETADGREVYSYLISCALDAGVTIEKSDVYDADTMALANDDYCIDGTCVFAGALGLAPEWTDKKLKKDGQGWVSACLFARINNNNEATDISLRGSHPSLEVSATEFEIYTVQEGAFYGNVFTNHNKPIDWNACRGRGEFENPDAAGLGTRDCAEPNTDPNADPNKTLCGMTYAGDCADYTDNGVDDLYACRYTDDLGNYTECSSGSCRPGNWGGFGKYRQVITVYVSQ